MTNDHNKYYKNQLQFKWLQIVLLQKDMKGSTF